MRLRCLCGAGITDQSDYLPNKAHPGGVEPLRFRASLVVTRILSKYSLDAYQCEACGRIWVEDHRDHDRRQMRSFAPAGEWEGTLDVTESRHP